MDREEWNKLVLEHDGDFLQSYEWGEFQRLLGRRVERIASDDFLAQVIFRNLGFGRNSGYVPRAPIFIRDSISENLFWESFEKIRDPSTIFFELDLLKPVSFLTPTSLQTRQPRITNILDLRPPESEILGRLHKNHRYSVRKTQEAGIRVKKGEDIRSFYDLLSLIAREHNFRIWPAGYYRKLYENLAPEGFVEIKDAYSSDKIIASHLYILFGQRVTHLFGGSTSSPQAGMTLSAVPLLHWEAIREFKNRGFAEYDFWGIEPKLPDSLVRFKERFGGRRVEYPGSYTRILKTGWYRAYKLARLAL